MREVGTLRGAEWGGRAHGRRLTMRRSACLRSAAVARGLAQHTLGHAIKVVVTDLDHTLWEGACSERAPDALQVEDTFCEAAQLALVAQVERRGRLVCIASKNDMADVEKVFQSKAQSMPLQMAHVTASKVNWGPKSESIAALARRGARPVQMPCPAPSVVGRALSTHRPPATPAYGRVRSSIVTSVAALSSAPIWLRSSTPS